MSRVHAAVLVAALVVPLAGCTATSGPTGVTSSGVTGGPGGPGGVAGSTALGLPRAVHRATTLTDGRVLFTGGCSTTGCGGFDAARASELYDPATGSFGPGPEMASPRASGTATLLPDGRVLLTGGFPGEGRAPQDAAEVFDPETDSFAAVTAMGEARAEHSASVLADGRVLLAGGTGAQGQVLRSTEVFDPATGQFEPGPELSIPRAAHAAVNVDSTVVLVGGTSDGDVGLASSEVLRADAWTPGPSLITARVKHAAVALPDGRVLVVGGSRDIEGRTRLATTELLDPATGRTTAGPELAEAQYKLDGAVTELPDHRIAIAGGTRVEVYDPATGTITVVDEPAVTARSFVSVSPLGDDLVLVAGGYDARITPSPQARLVRIAP